MGTENSAFLGDMGFGEGGLCAAPFADESLDAMLENHEFLRCGETPIGGVLPSSDPVLVNPGAAGDSPPIGIGFAVVVDVVVVEDVMFWVLDGALSMKPLVAAGADAGANSGVAVPGEAE